MPTWSRCPRFTELVSIDHIVPVSAGGTTEASNLRVVHAFCNLSDGARVPAEHRAPPPFGYVRPSEILADGRGPRTWIEVDENAAAIVRFVMSEYATGEQSMASPCRLLKRRARRFKRKAIAPLVTGAERVRAEELLYLVEYHARSLSEREVRAGYVSLVPAKIATTACGKHLAIRYDRIKRARETRERHLLERTQPTSNQSSRSASARADPREDQHAALADRTRLAARIAATTRRAQAKSRVPQ